MTKIICDMVDCEHIRNVKGQQGICGLKKLEKDGYSAESIECYKQWRGRELTSKFKFGEKVTWTQLSIKGNVKFAEKAIALDPNTINNSVGICLENAFEMKYVNVSELKKGWKRRGGLSNAR